MIQASIHGRIGSDPTRSTTAKGTDMTRASIAVDVAGFNGEDDETLWVSVLAFGKASEILARATKGETLSAIGKLTRGRFTGKDGRERESWSLIADAVLTLRSARPGQRKQGNPAARAPQTDRWERDGDELGF